MPELTWATKTPPQPAPARLVLDSLVYPHGQGYVAEAGSDQPARNLPNRLILGDNLAVMSALLPEYAGRIDLIYADPPFFTNRKYPARVGRGEDSRRPQEWRLVEGYPDFWTDLDAYLDFLYARLHLMHRLLSPTGTLYLHLDWHASAYARLLLDEIFGAERLLNEIAWVYHGPSPVRRAFNRKHDTILIYTKSERFTFNADAVREPYHPNTVKTFKSSSKAGFGKVPDLQRGKVPEDWWYFPVVARLHSERSGYPTQKPQGLLERIILASSNRGDLVADFFSGSGTAPVVAARLGRRFLANDAAWRAIHITRCRLIAQASPPFSLETCQPANLPISQSTHLQTNQQPNNPGFRAATTQPPTFHLSGQTLDLSTSLDLDYWEVDPSWDGRVFRSLAQIIRPRDTQAIETRLDLPIPVGNKPLRVRMVTVQGDVIEATIEPQ